jgi:hypothetical protein
MKLTRFDPPAQIDDLAGNAAGLQAWSDLLSGYFTEAVTRISNFLTSHHSGTSQFYNPVSNGIVSQDLTHDITWNGFPKRFVAQQPGQQTNYAAAESAPAAGVNRPQDEYLEWHVTRNGQGKIQSVQFTCEGPDYWAFLAAVDRNKVLALYRQYINPAVEMQDLFAGNNYNRLNRWNTRDGAMHLTHPANNLFAEVQLGGEATVRRQKNNVELTSSSQLIQCALYGDATRNSDPKIGAEVNAFARQGYRITLANPVGLYIHSLDDHGWQFADGTPAQGFFQILRGTGNRILRAEYRLPANLEAQGRTVSDVLIGGQPIQFGGQIAEKITMKLTGSVCQQGSVTNPPSPCGPVPQLPPGPLGAVPGLIPADLKVTRSQA